MERQVLFDYCYCCCLIAITLTQLASAKAAPAAGATFDERQEGKVNVQIDVKDVQIVALVDSDMFEDYTNYDYAYDYADFTIKPRPTPSKPPSNTTAETSWSTAKPADNSIPSDSFSTITYPQSSPTTAQPTTANTPTTTLAVAVSPSNSSVPNLQQGIGNSTILVIPELVVTNDTNEAVTTTTTTITNRIEASTTTTTTPAPTRQASSTSINDINSTTVTSEIVKPDGEKRPQVMAEPRKRCPVGFHLKSGRCFKRRLSVISPRLAIMKLMPGLLSK